MTCQFSDLMLTSLLADIRYGHCLYDIRLCICKMLMNTENTFKRKAFWIFFYNFLLEFGLLHEQFIFLLNIGFALFVHKTV